MQPTSQRPLIRGFAVLAVHVDDPTQVVRMRVVQQRIHRRHVHVGRQCGGRQRRIPNAKRRHIAVVIDASVPRAPQIHPRNLSDDVVFARTGQPKLAVHKHPHDTCFHVFGESPVHPASLQDAFTGVLFNAIVPPVVPTIPVGPAVAPRQMDVDFALVGSIHPFEQCGVCRQHRGIPANPAFQRDGRVNAEQRHGVDFHTVVAVHAHELWRAR